MHNRIILYSSAFLRAFATGLMGVALAIYLSKEDFDASQIGLIISVGLIGASLASVIATLFGDIVGKRRLLIAFSIFSGAGGLFLALTSDYSLLLAASFFGMLNGMGRDRGSLLILETAALPQTVADKDRTLAFAWYTFVQDVGIAVGGLTLALTDFVSFRILFVAYSVAFFVTGLLYFLLTSSVDSSKPKTRLPISREGRDAVTKLSLLFGIDAVAGGFLTTSLLAYFFYERFSVSLTVVGFLFFAARVLNGFSHFAAAWLAKRIGLVNTMVFTHIPSSVLLASVVIAPNFPVAAVLFLLRETFVEMDVPTRQSYLMAIVKPEERIFAAGVTNIVRMLGWSVAPAFAGLFMTEFSMAIPVFIGAGLKIVYDILLYLAFRNKKPPEET